MKFTNVMILTITMATISNAYAKKVDAELINAACTAESSTFCKNGQGVEMKVGKGLLTCLRANKDRVSEGCKKAMKAGKKKKNEKKTQDASQKAQNADQKSQNADQKSQNTNQKTHSKEQKTQK